MTLIVAATEPGSIWLSADRRITFANGAPKDDAQKILLLETDDGKAILGYCGLGQTIGGTEPAKWMSDVLRGRRLPLEQSLGILADACKRELPRHLVRLPGNGGLAHNIIIPALVHNEPRFYTIDFIFSPDRKTYNFRYTRHVSGRSAPAKPRTPRFAIAGSGAPYILARKKKLNDILRILRAYGREKVSALAVADHFASLNYEVHQGTQDQTVGPRCIVVWRNGKDGARRGGGGEQRYTGTKRDNGGTFLPNVGNGRDLAAFFKAIMPHMMRQLDMAKKGQPAEIDKEQINAEIARLPDKPDENLR